MLIGSLFLIVFIGFAGASLISLSSAEVISSVNSSNLTQTRYATNAAFEIARRLLDKGLDPMSKTETSFNKAILKITTDPALGAVWASGTRNKAIDAHSITAQFAAQCVTYNTDAVFSENSDLKGVNFVKIDACNNDYEIPVKLRITVNSADCAIASSPPVIDCPGEEEFNPSAAIKVSALSLDGQLVYDAAAGVGSPGGGAGAGEAISITSFSMSDNREYSFAPSNPSPSEPSIRFDEDLPAQAVFEIKAEFADRSVVSTVFKAATVAAPAPPPSGNFLVNDFYCMNALYESIPLSHTEGETPRAQCLRDQIPGSVYASYAADFVVDLATVRTSGNNPNLTLTQLESGMNIPVNVVPADGAPTPGKGSFVLQGDYNGYFILEPGNYRFTIIGSSDPALAIGGSYETDPETNYLIQQDQNFYFEAAGSLLY